MSACPLGRRLNVRYKQRLILKSGISRSVIYRFCLSATALNVEQEVQYVAFLDDVFLAFLAQPTGCSGTRLALVLDEIVVADGFGADKALFEIGMDDACRLRRGRASLDRPGAHFLHARGEVGLQPKQFVARTDHTIEARLFQAIAGQ